MITRTLRLTQYLDSVLKEWVLRISPKTIMLIMAALIFLVEALVMLILNVIPPLNKEVEALVDSTILLLLLSPFYLHVYRPFWEERQKQTRQIRLLSQELITATEAESKRIAHEIHDQCGQTLTALQFGIQTLKTMIAKRDASCQAHTEYLEQIASQLSDELRSLTSQLRPPILDQAGLISAISWQVDTFRKNYPDVAVTHRLPDKTEVRSPLSTTAEEAIYRICQEALTNIARHASATAVQVTMVRKDHSFELKIKDNGVGFNLEDCLEEAERACRIGLLGMRERALMVGGTFKINTRVGEGTLVLATFPF